MIVEAAFWGLVGASALVVGADSVGCVQAEGYL